MNREFLTEESYDKFLDEAIYQSNREVNAENTRNLRKNIRDFCRVQLEKFEGGNKTGCCLNFTTYLLSKYYGFLLTCKDGGALHCAFVYPKLKTQRVPLVDGRNNAMLDKNGNVMLRDSVSFDMCVCDPALAKIKGDEKFFDIPLAEYSFPAFDKEGNEIVQQYCIYTSLHPDITKRGLLDYINTRTNNINTIAVEDMSQVREEKLRYKIGHMQNERLFKEVGRKDTVEYNKAKEIIRK